MIDGSGMENIEKTPEQQLKMEAHRIQSERCMRLAVEELGANDARAVTSELMYHTAREKESPTDWRQASAVLAASFLGLVLRERFRALPYWAVRRFVGDEYDLTFIASHARPYRHAGEEADNPENLAALATVKAWLEADGQAHPEIRRYMELDDEELKVLLHQAHLRLPLRLEAAASDAGWLGGRPWQNGRSWSQPWLNRLADEGRLAHFYAWLKDRSKRTSA
jgi:hypothetical protein